MCGVETKDDQARALMPVNNDFGSVLSLGPNKAVVNLDGISHLVLSSDDPEAKALCSADSLKAQKELALDLLRRYDLDKRPAAGVIVVGEEASGLAIKPFVYVRDIDTFYYESACGSGTLAVGLAKANKSQQSIKGLRLLQPSGMPIEVDVELNDQGIILASINGPVKILYEGPMSLVD